MCLREKKSAQIREILISESAWEEMTCLFAPSLASWKFRQLRLKNLVEHFFYSLYIQLEGFPLNQLKDNYYGS